MHPRRLPSARVALSLVALAAASAFGQTVPSQVKDKAAYLANLRTQMSVLMREKATRTPAMQKMDTALVFAVRAAKGQSLEGLPKLQTHATLFNDGTVNVEIGANVTPMLVNRLKNLGAYDVGVYPRDNSVSARIPVRSLEAAAMIPGVRFIKRPSRYVRNTGLSQTEGDVSMISDRARLVYGLSGKGVKVGVMSDSNDEQETSQLFGDLPANIEVLPGRDGRPGTGEGTAMMEIVNDVAPGSPLAFSTALDTQAAFAQNYRDLFAAGCKVICDDVIYFEEPAFQDGPVARAINDIVDAGGIVFSAAGNYGSGRSGDSGVWEGDFRPSGQFYKTEDGKEQPIHAWTSDKQTLNTIESTGSEYLMLQWNDPWGDAQSDYDLYTTDFFGDVLNVSNANNLGGNPYEECDSNAIFGSAFVVKASGPNRVIRLAQLGGQLAYGTTGQIWGHAAAKNGIGVAAINASLVPERPFNAADETTDYSSDGLRRVYYDENGVQIAPSLTYAGAVVRKAPAMAGPDGVSTSVTGFERFFGTSAAAPHAAALTALLREFAPDATPAQLFDALTKGAVDILTRGYDNDSGYGAVSAKGAIKVLLEGKTLGVSPATATLEGTAPVTLTLDLGRNAPPKGIVVKVAATGDTDRFSFPKGFTVPAGARTLSFAVEAGAAGTGALNLKLTENFTGAALGSVAVNRIPAGVAVGSVTVDPSEVVGASRNVAGKVTLAEAAPSATTIELQSSNPAVASVPATVAIGTNGTFKTFVVATTAVATDTTVTIRARRQGSTGDWKASTMLVKAAVPNSCLPNPVSGPSGTGVTFTLKLSGPAPTGGLTVGVVTTDTNLIAVPRTVTFPAGATMATFKATVGAATAKKTVTVSLRYQNATVAQGRFLVTIP